MVFFSFESFLKCKSNEGRNSEVMDHWEKFWKTRKLCLGLRLQTNWSEFENIIDKFLFLKPEEEALVCKKSDNKFWIFVSFSRYCSKQFIFTEVLKITKTVLETRYWYAIVQHLGPFPSYPFGRSNLEKEYEEHTLRHDQLLYNCLLKSMHLSSCDGL